MSAYARDPMELESIDYDWELCAVCREPIPVEDAICVNLNEGILVCSAECESEYHAAREDESYDG